MIFRIVNVYDENGETYFKTEQQMFETGTGGFNGNKTNPHLTQLAKQKTTIPDCILEFATVHPKDGFKATMSDSDVEISNFSPLQPWQNYSPHENMSHPVANGRYTFGGVIKLLLFTYADGNVAKFKAAKVRVSENQSCALSKIDIIPK